MLHFFPIPYPDELLYSLACRYHVRSGNRSFRQTQFELFKITSTKQYYLGLPNNLAILVSHLPFGSTLTIAQLLEQYTLFPYYRTFLIRLEVRRLKELMEGKESQSIPKVAKIPKLKLYYPDYLRFCPQCLEEDLQEYGETYWHRLHQVAGIRVRLTHQIGLRNSSVLMEEVGKGFVAADENNCVGYEVNDERAFLPGLWEFSKVVERKMSENSSFQGLEDMRNKYKQDLINRGWLKAEKLAKAILERYGEGVLRVIHPEMMDDLGDYVLGCLLGCDLLQEVDRVIHWLAGEIIEIKI